jgi:SAM-dependent methyltransferase
VTERANTFVSPEQITRIHSRYGWAREYAVGKKVLEIACGTGQGIGCYGGVARAVVGLDVSAPMLATARRNFARDVRFLESDGTLQCVAGEQYDLIILFEALYYFPAFERVLDDIRLLLSPGGTLLLCSSNRSLEDFTPSPLSTRYYDVPEMTRLLQERGFEVDAYGSCAVSDHGMRGACLRFLKKQATRLGLIPKTMRGKQWLKRIFFGKLVPMPERLDRNLENFEQPIPIDKLQESVRFKVIYWAAKLGRVA